MSLKLKWIIGAIITLIVVAGGVSYGVYQHNKPLTDQEFKELEIDKQFDKAPEGHYIHLRKNDATLYRTNWSKNKIKNFMINWGSNDVITNEDGTTTKKTLNSNGTTNIKTKLGTNHVFNDNILLDEEEGDGILGEIWDSMYDNGYWESKKNVSDKSDLYKWYFNSPQQAQKDADVKDNVTQIVR